MKKLFYKWYCQIIYMYNFKKKIVYIEDGESYMLPSYHICNNG
jgi:hypothetical protein